MGPAEMRTRSRKMPKQPIRTVATLSPTHILRSFLSVFTAVSLISDILLANSPLAVDTDSAEDQNVNIQSRSGQGASYRHGLRVRQS